MSLLLRHRMADGAPSLLVMLLLLLLLLLLLALVAPCTAGRRSVALLLAVQLLQRLQLLDQGLVLVLQHSHPVL